MGGRCRFPCNKIKHPDACMAKLHLDFLLARNPDHKMAIYSCDECSAKDNTEVWHVGHVRSNGTAYVKTSEGKRVLRKVEINNENISSYLS
jgi:hypothetical protein